MYYYYVDNQDQRWFASKNRRNTQVFVGTARVVITIMMVLRSAVPTVV